MLYHIILYYVLFCIILHLSCIFFYKMLSFYLQGILCSPLFEGKTYGQMNAMVNRVLEPLGDSFVCLSLIELLNNRLCELITVHSWSL